jgi:hypothetical protein
MKNKYIVGRRSKREVGCNMGEEKKKAGKLK